MPATIGTLKTLEAYRRFLAGELTLDEFQAAEVGYTVSEIDLKGVHDETRNKMSVEIVRK